MKSPSKIRSMAVGVLALAVLFSLASQIRNTPLSSRSA
jgi:hypothetical protein